LTQAVMLLSCILKVCGVNLGWDTDYPHFVSFMVVLGPSK